MTTALTRPPREPGRSEALTPSWTSALYRAGGKAAALAALLTPVSVAVFALSPPPEYNAGARVWFEHIDDNGLLGWMSLDLPLLLISVLMIPLMVALIAAVRHVRPAHVLVAAALYFVAVATYFGTNTSVELVSLSSRYAEASTNAERLALEGAGDALLAAYTGTAFHINYILGQMAGIILGFVMLRSELFGRAVPSLMIAGNTFGFLLYVPEVGIALSALSGLILWAWMIGVSLRLLRLADAR